MSVFPRPPAVIGHRGAPRAAAENTPASFAAAFAAGADWVEFDVRLGADGVPVVYHDPCTPDGVPVVEQRTNALAAHGVWSLAGVLESLPEGLGADLEVKNKPGDPDFDETAERSAAAIAGVLAATAPRGLLVTSFNPLSVAAVAEAVPGVPCGLMTTTGLRPASALELCAELGVAVWAPAHDTPGLATALAERDDAGPEVLVWTVDDPAEARRLADAGAHAICSNDPGAIAAALRD